VCKLAIAKVHAHMILLVTGAEEDEIPNLGFVKGNGAASTRLVSGGARHRHPENIAVEQLHER
jgi:hypothetical protein